MLPHQAQLMYLYIRASELLPAGIQGDALFLSHTARKDHQDAVTQGGFLVDIVDDDILP